MSRKGAVVADSAFAACACPVKLDVDITRMGLTLVLYSRAPRCSSSKSFWRMMACRQPHGLFQSRLGRSNLAISETF